MSVTSVPRFMREMGLPASGRAESAAGAPPTSGLDEAPQDEAPQAETISLSPFARRLLDPSDSEPAVSSTDDEAAKTPGESRLTKQDLQEVERLKARDAEVRVHEAAHAATAGGLGGRPSLEYSTGPDGHRYAVSGEVSIDMSPGRTPQETLTRARTIRAAATAPADPSAQDMAVAASAARMEAEAQREIQEARVVQSNARPEQAQAADPGGGAPAERTSSDASAHDPDRTVNALIRERAQAFGDRGHAHGADGCGFCRGAARAYQP
jgi:hypothetical protein